MSEENGKTRKLAIINSKGSLDTAYSALVMANSARMIDIDVVMFFSFSGMDIITKEKQSNLKVSPTGNTSVATATPMMKKDLDRVEAPPVDEFLEMVHDAGAKLYACQMSVDMMNLTDEDFVDQVDGVVSAMEFLELAEGAQLVIA